jgi:hypothetical protein
MLRSSRRWRWLPVALTPGGCAALPSGAAVPSAPPSAGSSLRLPGGLRFAEYPNLPTIRNQTAAHLTRSQNSDPSAVAPQLCPRLKSGQC